MNNVSNNLWGNPNREVTNASDVTRRRAGCTVYNNVKKHTSHVIKNSLSRKKNKHTYGIGYDTTDTNSKAAILTSRSYQDKYMISKAKFCCSKNDNIDYLKKEAYNGNKLVVKYNSEQIIYTGNVNLNTTVDNKYEVHDLIRDPSTEGEGFFIKGNYDNWVDDIAEISYNKTNSFINQRKLNPINNKKYTIKGPIILE